MRRLALLPLLLSSTALTHGVNAQTPAPTPAQMGISQTTPQTLNVLDKTRTWVPIGQLGGGAFAFFGAKLKADGYVSADAAMAAGSAMLAVASRPCASGDAGKVVVVSGADVGQGTLKTTVASCSGSAYLLSLPNASGGDISAMQWAIGSDDSAALNAQASALKQACLSLPPGRILLDATQVALDQVCLRGQNVPGNRIAAKGANADQGTTLLLVSQTVQPLLLKSSVMLDGINYFWPGQAGVPVNPIRYPPLFATPLGAQAGDLKVRNGNIINAYDVFTQPSPYTPIGNIHWDDMAIYAVHQFAEMGWLGEIMTVNGSVFNPFVYQSINAAAPKNLINWSASNSIWMNAPGNGTPTTCSTLANGGFTVSGGSVINGYALLLNVQNGMMQESTFDSSTDLNAIGQVVNVGAAGILPRLKVAGRVYPNIAGPSSIGPMVNIASTCSGTSFNDLEWTADVIGARRGLFNFDNGGVSANPLYAKITGSFLQYGADAAISSPVYLMYLNYGASNVTMTGNTSVGLAPTDANRGGVKIVAGSLTYSGNVAQYQYYPLDFTSMTGGAVTAVGNTMAPSNSPTTIGDPPNSAIGANIRLALNTIDKPSPFSDKTVLNGATPSLAFRGSTPIAGRRNWDMAEDSSGNLTISAWSDDLSTSSPILTFVRTGTLTNNYPKITDTNSAGTNSLVIDASADANGMNLRLIGNGATTPNKTIKVQNGLFQIANSAYSANIFQITDAGAASLPGLPTSAGAGGLAVCIDSSGAMYKKASCP